jgi:hypothetical protein
MATKKRKSSKHKATAKRRKAPKRKATKTQVNS